tara:strand:+ start:560 stop:781 length:222 start_codon:yes stop_codon:yes gene_type:complete
LTSFNFLSVLETVKILKLESEQITKKLDLLIVHLVENNVNEKVDFIYDEIIKQEKQSLQDYYPVIKRDFEDKD